MNPASANASTSASINLATTDARVRFVVTHTKRAARKTALGLRVEEFAPTLRPYGRPPPTPRAVQTICYCPAQGGRRVVGGGRAVAEHHGRPLRNASGDVGTCFRPSGPHTYTIQPLPALPKCGKHGSLRYTHTHKSMQTRACTRMLISCFPSGPRVGGRTRWEGGNHGGRSRQEGCQERVVKRAPPLGDPSFDNPLDYSLSRRLESKSGTRPPLAGRCGPLGPRFSYSERQNGQVCLDFAQIQNKTAICASSMSLFGRTWTNIGQRCTT